MNKSYVTIEQKQCVICGKTFDTNALLMDMRLKDTFEMHTVTGLGRCDDCETRNRDYIALIVADERRSIIEGDQVKIKDAYRTGEVDWLKRSVAKEIFNTLDIDFDTVEFVFIDIPTHISLTKIGGSIDDQPENDSDHTVTGET